MFTKQLLFIAFIVIAAGCNNTKKESLETAIQFSEKIVNTEQELAEPLAHAEQMILAKLDSSDFESMGAIADEAETLIADRVKEIKALSVKGFKGGEAFRSSAINYFEYVKSIFTNYKNIGYAKTEGARLYEVCRMDSLRSRQQPVIMKMQAAQKQFADDNGFKVNFQQ